MSNQLSSKIALAYTGTNATRPPNMFIFNRAPTPTDYQNFSLGDYWLYRINPMQNNGKLYVLLGLVANVANWALITSSSGIVEFLQGNSGGPVGPNASQVINVIGDGTTVNVVGNPATNTLTISTASTVADSFPTDSGTATPSAGVLNIKADVSTLNCGSSVEFTGSSNTVLLNVTDANNNTIIGKSSGLAGITGTDNTIIGEGNGTGLTSGVTNIFIGTGNGTNLTTEGSNTIIGTNIDGVVGSGGYVAIGQSSSDLFINNFPGNGGGNVFIGYFSGESALNINNSDNTSVGQSSCEDLTSGASNACYGYQAGASLTTGSNNTLIGRDAGLSVTTGTRNLCVGYGSGNTYTSSESGNIIIGNGDVNGESNTLHIGYEGAGGASSLTAAYIDGIDGVALTTPNVVTEVSGQLGSAAITGGTNITVDATSTPNQIIINGSSGDATSFPTDSGTATPSAGVLNIKGDSGVSINTSGSGNTVNIAIAQPASVSFTPYLTFGGATTGITYDLATYGFYQTIGSVVFYTMSIDLTSKGSATGVARIQGFPLSNVVHGVCCAVRNTDMSYTGIVYGIQLTSSIPAFVMELNLATGSPPDGDALTDANFTNDSILQVSGFYFTN